MTDDGREVVEIGARAACARDCGTMRLMGECRCIGWRAYEAHTGAALTAIEASGRWRIVPVEPTEDMLVAGLQRALDWMKENGVTGLSPFSEFPSPTETIRVVVAAMIAASPKATG